MQPLSSRRRLVYLLVIVLLFCAVLPFALFYANGYRWKSGTGIVRTGGVFVSVPYSDAHISIDGEWVGEAGFLRRDFYIDNLVPNAYTISVEREGYRTWERIVVVEEQLVTDTRALLVPDKIELLELIIATSSATTTKGISEEDFERIQEEFLEPMATTSRDSFSSIRGESIVIENGDVSIYWEEGDVFPPSKFCGRPSFCGDAIVIERGEEETTDAVFFYGGVVFRTEEGGIYFAEADVRPLQVELLLYKGMDVDFRIIDRHVVVKDGKRLFELVSF